MQLWRVSRHRDLNGTGGLTVSGRWHSLGHLVIYTSEHQGTAQLEWLAHLDVASPADFPLTVPFSEILVDGAASRSEVRREDLPAEWESDEGITQRIGDDWLDSVRSLLLFVPSVLVPARNVLVNPLHSDAIRMRIVRSFDFPLDARLS